MLEIGLMLDSPTSSAWVAQIVNDIQQSSFARIALVIRNTPAQPRSLSLRKRVDAHWRQTLFHKYEAWDYLRNRGPNDAKASTDLSSMLAGVPSLQVQPIRKGFTDRFTPADLAAIQDEKLDVIFRFGFRIIRGEILTAARYGVWSFHHDDNRDYRGGPPLFWEIFEANPVSGAILQVLTDSLDGGRVLYRGPVLHRPNLALPQPQPDLLAHRRLGHPHPSIGRLSGASRNRATSHLPRALALHAGHL